MGSGQGSPFNWNAYELSDVGSPISGLIAEDGEPTSVSVQISTPTGNQDRFLGSPLFVPIHSPDLDSICCDILHSGPNPMVVTWTGLFPLSLYDYWIFTSSSAVDTISAIGDNSDSFVSPGVVSNSQNINGVVGNSSRSFQSYARQVVSTQSGTIVLNIASAGTPALSAVAVKLVGEEAGMIYVMNR